MKTYTPDLDPAVPRRLRDYAALCAADFPQAKPARGAGVYLEGLLLDGERKSIEPLSRRVTLPGGLSGKDPEQALQPFVNQSPRDDPQVRRRYRAHLAQTLASPDGIFAIDGTTFPKQGTSSVGVQRQYGRAQGKRANGQAAGSVHDVGPPGHYPRALRRVLPDSGLADRKRRDRAGVPEAFRRARAKGQIARDLLDPGRAGGVPGRGGVADAGYGASGPFRRGLADRGSTDLVGGTDELVVFPDPPPGSGRRPGRPPRSAQTWP